jgi:large subunit ribosomal protein L15
VSTTIRIGNLRPAAGATHAKKRRGKGAATGLGGTAGKGPQGQEGARRRQDPGVVRGRPDAGAAPPAEARVQEPGRVEYEVVNVGRLALAAAGTTVDRAWLESNRIVRRPGPIKLLGVGEIKSALTVKVDAASQTARKAIESAGGKVEILKAAGAAAAAAVTEAPRARKPGPKPPAAQKPPVEPKPTVEPATPKPPAEER